LALLWQHIYRPSPLLACGYPTEYIVQVIHEVHNSEYRGKAMFEILYQVR